MKLFAFIWILLILVSFSIFYSYSREEGSFADKGDYSEASAWLRDNVNGDKSLAIFLHPKCPCSRARVKEFANILSKNDKINPIVVFSIANGLEDFQQDITYLKNILVDTFDTEYKYFDDYGLNLAEKFGAETSGYTLYFENGNLKFRGGLTPTRAHLGNTIAHDNLKQTTINNFFQTPVYGCEIGDIECKQ